MNKVYVVQTWDDTINCVRDHEVVDAIDCDDAEQVVSGMHPDQKVLSVVIRNEGI